MRESQNPCAVRRERLGIPVAQPNGRRTVGTANINAIGGAARFSDFSKEKSLSVIANRSGKGVIKPGELPPARISVDKGLYLLAARVANEQDAAIASHVEDRQRSGDAREQATVRR